MITWNQNMKKQNKTCYMDTDSFVVYIKKDFYVDIAKNIETRSDTWNHESERALPKWKNKKVTGLLKDELSGKSMTGLMDQKYIVI